MTNFTRRSFLEISAKVSMGAGFFSLCPQLAFAKKNADLIYINGAIITMDGKNTSAEALAISNGFIVAVGKKHDVLNLQGKNTKIVDLQGRTLMPGFIDGHGHFPSSGMYELTQVNLNVPPLGTVTSVDGLVATLKARADKTPAGKWIVGYNYNDIALKEQRHPTKVDLDKVSTKHPIFIRHVSGHLGVGNTMALQKAGIKKTTVSPMGGTIRLGSNGEPDGVLEGPPAKALVENLIPKPSKKTIEKAIRYSAKEYAKMGITTAQNGGSPDYDDLFIRLADENDLNMRLVIWPGAYDPSILERYGRFRSGDLMHSSGMITLGAAKLWADGSPQGYTAYFSKPYYKVPAGKPKDFRGFPTFEKEDLIQRVQAMHNDGWQIAIHGNGDQAIEEILDAYEIAQNETAKKDMRHIVVHSQFARFDQVERMAKLGVHPSFFIGHTFYWGDAHRALIAGPKRAENISPAKKALQEDIIFSFHNDTPVTPIDPMLQVFAGVNRVTSSGYVLGKKQRIDVADALKAITINAAYMHKEEKTKGSLEMGKLADLVILEKNPLKVPVEELKDIRVEETIIGGKTVYRG